MFKNSLNRFCLYLVVARSTRFENGSVCASLSIPLCGQKKKMKNENSEKSTKNSWIQILIHEKAPVVRNRVKIYNELFAVVAIVLICKSLSSLVRQKQCDNECFPWNFGILYEFPFHQRSKLKWYSATLSSSVAEKNEYSGEVTNFTYHINSLVIVLELSGLLENVK